MPVYTLDDLRFRRREHYDQKHGNRKSNETPVNGTFTQCSEDQFDESGINYSVITSDTSSTVTLEKEPTESSYTDVADCVSSSTQPILLTQFKKLHIQKLAGSLDMSSTIVHNWKHLADEILREFDDKEKLMQDLELYYCGGGSPGNSFLSKLRTLRPNISIEEFMVICKKIKRFDILEYLNTDLIGFLPNTKIWDLDKKDKKHLLTIGSDLNIDDSWEMFAEEFEEFDRSTIKTIRKSMKEEKVYSPTEELFRILEQKKPNLALDDLRKICKKLDMNNVDKMLGEFADEISNGK